MLNFHRQAGSSILASLSEAGGNDPFHPMFGPLPSPFTSWADRVGTRPTPLSRHTRGPSPESCSPADIPVFSITWLYVLKSPTAFEFRFEKRPPRLARMHLSPADALGFNRSTSPHFSRTYVIETCPTFRAAA